MSARENRKVVQTVTGRDITKGKRRQRSRPKVVARNTDVMEAARKRIAWLFDEFDGQVSVGSSGGKDSTVVVELALAEARRRGQRLTVMWLDQECEYTATRDYQRSVADRPDVDFQWYQVPFKLFNATNHKDEWLRCWDPTPGIEWARDREDDSIHVNPFVRADGTPVDRFTETLAHINRRNGGVVLTGMRCEESPARRLTMTTRPAHKWATWTNGSIESDGFVFAYPIYDWTYRDVWKAIQENGWPYNRYYDYQAQHGLPVRDMRVSNYHHETALHALAYLQEAEPETWDRATRRLEGLNAYAHLGGAQTPKSLPHMFASWEEYMWHLIGNLYASEEHRDTFAGLFFTTLHRVPEAPRDVVAKMVADCVIGNDLYGTRVQNWTLNARGKLNLTGNADWERRLAAEAAYRESIESEDTAPGAVPADTTTEESAR